MGDILPFDKVNITQTNEDGEEVTHTIKLTEESRGEILEAAVISALGGLLELFSNGPPSEEERAQWINAVIYTCRQVAHLSTCLDNQSENEE